ncbi:MAG TPA: hypothetical protein VHT30_01405 [Acidimicrobiales bacterium]|jgi:hypothetical protein|nr:hypothetical protein [Acidimicrobiales bacterium]
MGLVRKLKTDGVAGETDAGTGAKEDMSSAIRQAVAAEIERQRLTKLGRDSQRPTSES